MEELKEFSTEELVKELEGRGKELTVGSILYIQLLSLKTLSENSIEAGEPELAVKISLAMSEIAKSMSL